MNKQIETKVEASATKTISELFTKEQLGQYVDNSLDMIIQGKPVIDGEKNVAACHYYNTDHGRIGTFCMMIQGSELKMYVGTEKEVNQMRCDLDRIADQSGVLINRNPKERADRRRKLRRKNRKAK